MSDPLDKFKDVNLEKLIFDDLVRQIREDENERLSYIIMHKVIEDYNNHTPIQRFFWNIKWGFKDCRDNFRNWKGHMNGEDWDFWEILSGEWSAYE